MGSNPEPAEAVNVLDHIPGLPGERVRSGRHIEGQKVSAARADLYAVQTQHTGTIRWWIQRPRRVAVIGEHEKLETGSTGGGGDRIRGA